MTALPSGEPQVDVPRRNVALIGARGTAADADWIDRRRRGLVSMQILPQRVSTLCRVSGLDSPVCRGTPYSTLQEGLAARVVELQFRTD